MKIYETTRQFPRDEIYGMTSQLRRAGLSVPTNIAEGMGRRTNKDKAHFLTLAEGSLNEVEYLLDVSHRLGYIKKEDYATQTNALNETARILHGLTRKLQDTPTPSLRAEAETPILAASS